MLTGMASMAVALGVLMLSTADGLFLQQARAELLRRNQGVAADIDGLTQRAAQALTLARQDPAFDAFYAAAPGSVERETARHIVESQVRALQKLFAIDEICLINADGAEDVRGVSGLIAGPDHLSVDETDNPFFSSTLALADDQVYRSSRICRKTPASGRSPTRRPSCWPTAATPASSTSRSRWRGLLIRSAGRRTTAAIRSCYRAKGTCSSIPA
jgi:hypothetical protein